MLFINQRINQRRKKEDNIRSPFHTPWGKEYYREARKIEIWNGMDEDIKSFVQSCPICQLQKTVRIKNQAESIIPDIPLAPNKKGVGHLGTSPDDQEGKQIHTKDLAQTNTLHRANRATHSEQLRIF